MQPRNYRGRRRSASPFDYETAPVDGVAAPDVVATVAGNGGGADAVVAVAPPPVEPAEPIEPGVFADEPAVGGFDAAPPEPAPWPTADGNVLLIPRRLVNRFGYGYPRRRYGRRYRRRYARPYGRPARRAVVRRIARLAQASRRIGTLRNRRSGRRYPVFGGRARGRPYQLVTRPRGRSRGRTRFEIVLVRGADSELDMRQDPQIEREFEMEMEVGDEQEFEREFELDQEGETPARRRQGVPNLDRAWARLRAASGPRRAPARRGGQRELYEAPPGPGGAGIKLSRMQVRTSIPLPTYGPVPFGPLLVTVAPRINLEGSASVGRSGTTVALTPGQMRTDFEGKVSSSFGEVSLTGGVEPGKSSRVGIKIGSETIEVQFQAQASLTEPFLIQIAAKSPIRRVVRYGDWVFDGIVKPSVVISMAPNPAWPGWGAAARGAARAAGGAARAVRGVVAVARGLFFAGEVAAGTALGAAGLGAGIALGGIAWVGFTLFMIGKAHEDGRAIRMGKEFCNGYGGMLASLTSGRAVLPDTPAGRRTYWEWLTFDWRAEFERQGQLWVKRQDRNALSRIREAGRMAAVQEADLFLRLYAPELWKRVVHQHGQKYGNDDSVRYRAYLKILYRQMKAGGPIGIPFLDAP